MRECDIKIFHIKFSYSYERGNKLSKGKIFLKEVIKLNYMQYPAQQQQQYGNVSRPTYSPNGWNNRIRPVSSIEEVRAVSIDFDGSVFYFSDLANKRIYTKQINLDGTALLNMYELKEVPIQENSGVIDTSNFITRGEFEETMNWVKNYLTTSLNGKTEAATEDPASKPKQENQRTFDF